MQQTLQTPKTGAELEVLRARRQELSSQLDEVTERRGRLGQERLNARARGDMAMVNEYDATIGELGARMTRLQREQDAADEAISDAVSRGVGQQTSATQTQVITLPGRAVSVGGAGGSLLPGGFTPIRTSYQKLMAFEAIGFIVLGALVARYVWVRARRSVRGSSAGEISELRTAVESIAIEVERISENQRYVTKLLTEGAATPVAARDAESVGDGVKR